MMRHGFSGQRFGFPGRYRCYTYKFFIYLRGRLACQHILGVLRPSSLSLIICSVRAILYTRLQKMMDARFLFIPMYRLTIAFILIVMYPKTCSTRLRLREFARLLRFCFAVSGRLRAPFSQIFAEMPLFLRTSSQAAPTYPASSQVSGAPSRVTASSA